jgi:hypothetical protein
MDKMIEEMANEICANNGTEFCASGRCYKQWECPLNFNSLEILYNAGYRKQEWISVEEKLPINDYGKHWKDRNHYLVFTQPCEIMFVATYGYKNNDWWCDMNDFVLDEKNWSTVTHWMPLPKKPKMKGAE